MRGGVDLEADGLALVDADVGGEALDARVAGIRATSHSLGGLPGLEFSQTIGFVTGGSHGPAAAAGAANIRAAVTVSTVNASRP